MSPGRDAQIEDFLVIRRHLCRLQTGASVSCKPLRTITIECLFAHFPFSLLCGVILDLTAASFDGGTYSVLKIGSVSQCGYVSPLGFFRRRRFLTFLTRKNRQSIQRSGK